MNALRIIMFIGAALLALLISALFIEYGLSTIVKHNIHITDQQMYDINTPYIYKFVLFLFIFFLISFPAYKIFLGFKFSVYKSKDLPLMINLMHLIHRSLLASLVVIIINFYFRGETAFNLTNISFSLLLRYNQKLCIGR